MELTERQIKNFWDKVNKTDTCWLWTASTNTWGYGQYNFNNKNHKAHRVSFELQNGEIPTGLELDHLCKVHSCVRPDHLEPVTHRENLLRGNTITASNAATTHCPQGHPYDEPNTGIYKYPSGRVIRFCRICSRIKAKYFKALRQKKLAKTA